jgi:hypothetical protein
MAATIAPVISTPLPGRVAVQPTLTGGGNFWRAWCTSAPLGSRFQLELAGVNATRFQAAEGVTSDLPELELDKGGAYTFVVQEYTKGASTYGGGYDGAPDGFQVETKIGAETTSTIYVGQRLVTRVGSPEYGYADAVVWVFNTRIQPTSLAVHGEVTPAFLNPTTARARIACQNSAALTTLATLGGIPAATTIGALDTLCAEMRTKIPLHFNNSPLTVYHGVLGIGSPMPDTDHDTAIEQLPSAPTTPAGFVAFFNTVRSNLAAHMANNPRNYHSTAGGLEPDYVHAMLAPLPASANMSQVLSAAGDIVSMYNAHIASATHHLNVDVTNNLTTALGQLVNTHKDFVAAMRPLSPTAPAALNPGAVSLIHGAGFEEKY